MLNDKVDQEATILDNLYQDGQRLKIMKVFNVSRQQGGCAGTTAAHSAVAANNKILQLEGNILSDNSGLLEPVSQ